MISESESIELGDKEAAFFLSEQRSSSEDAITKRLHHLECPKFDCYFRIEKVLKTIRPKVHIFYIIFEHYRDKHYHLQKKEHTRFQNLCYAILQELVVFEASTGKNEEKMVKRSIAVHNLLKHQGISLRNLSWLMNISESTAGSLAYFGYSNCSHCQQEEAVD
ncbi:MAG: hypothetical protein WCC17_06460 [Candidatus Nitrosopolaris sp.]